MSLATKKIDTTQLTKVMAEMATSAWATLHTELRQKSSWLMNTPRATAPANQKRTLVLSNARAAYGWDAVRSR